MLFDKIAFTHKNRCANHCKSSRCDARRAAACPSPTAACLWDSDWKQNDGDNAVRDLGEIDGSTPETLCQNPKFPPV
jgi:hypothetical protein